MVGVHAERGSWLHYTCHSSCTQSDYMFLVKICLELPGALEAVHSYLRNKVGGR